MYTPSIFTVETFLGCNLMCPECACGAKKITRKPCFLSLEKFKIIADKIKPYAKYAFLHTWGEPLLNPDIIEIIKYGQQFFQTQISTNGQNITKEFAEQLISTKTDICISLDGMTQEIYKIYRVNGDIDKVFNALEMLQNAQKKYNDNRRLQVQFIVFKHNQHQMEEFKSFCKSKNVIESFKSPAIYCNSELKNSDLSEFIRTPVSVSKINQCSDLYNVFTIAVDGSVVMCCYDYNCSVIFGNIFNQDVLEIYNSAKVNEIRKTMPIDFCINNCLL